MMTRSIVLLLLTILLLSSGFFVWAEDGNNIEKYSWLLLLDKPNQAPEIDPDVAIEFNWPTNSVQLDAIVTDDPNDALVYEWIVVNGPGDVTFSSPDAEDITAEFSAFGTYVLQLSVSDGEFTPEPVEVTVIFNFLEKYTNPQQQKLPANRVYPIGQKMMLTAWLGKNDSDLEKMKAHGFSMQGPQWDTRASVNDPVMRKGKEVGIRAAYRLVDNGGSASKLLPFLDNGEMEAMLYRNIKGGLLAAINKPDYNDQIDVWLAGTEELSTNNTNNVDKFNRYLKNVQKIVQDNDPQQRPLWMSDVTGVSKSSMMVTHKYLDMVGPQIYLGRIDPNGSGYTTDAVMGGIARTIVGTAKELNALYPGKYPHAATGSLDALYEPIPSRDGAAKIDKIVEHWLYLGFNNGMQGYQFYTWQNYLGGKYADTETWNWLKDAYYKHVKRLTDYELDYVYLWGNRRSDLSMKILSGPTTVKGYPSISMQNIQYGDHRYVMITNSADLAVQVEVNGFPNICVITLDIHEDKYLDNNGSISTILQPLDVRLYRFDAVDVCSIQ